MHEIDVSVARAGACHAQTRDDKALGLLQNARSEEDQAASGGRSARGGVKEEKETISEGKTIVCSNACRVGVLVDSHGEHATWHTPHWSQLAKSVAGESVAGAPLACNPSC